MLYSSRHRFVFVHVWKTAGESIVKSLRPLSDPVFRYRLLEKAIRSAPDSVTSPLGWRSTLVKGQHLPAVEIREILPPGAFDAAYSFGFVRNPWDRIVSGFHYGQQTSAHPEHPIVSRMTNISEYITFREHNHPIPQTNLLFDQNDRQLVTRIGRFESLEADFQQICQDIGVEVTLARRNMSRRGQDWRAYFTDKDYARVGQLYRRDLELLGYEA